VGLGFKAEGSRFSYVGKVKSVGSPRAHTFGNRSQCGPVQPRYNLVSSTINPLKTCADVSRKRATQLECLSSMWPMHTRGFGCSVESKTLQDKTGMLAREQ